MKQRKQKEQDFQALKQILENNPHYFVTGYEKMTVAQDFALRKLVREAGGMYRVIKNNLATKATEGTEKGTMFGKIVGMTSLAYTNGDPVALAKALTAYAKTNAALTFEAGVVEGRVIDIRQIEQLSNLPSKPELMSKLLYLLNSGPQRLAVSLNGLARNLAIVIDQAAKEGKFQ